jgi:hypothetical protein
MLNTFRLAPSEIANKAKPQQFRKVDHLSPSDRLRKNRAGALWGGNDQWGRKQLGPVVLDLLDHLLQNGCGRVIGTRPHLLCKGLNFSLKNVHVDQLAVMIESLVSGHWSDAQSLAQLIEQWAWVSSVEGVPKGDTAKSWRPGASGQKRCAANRHWGKAR